MEFEVDKKGIISAVELAIVGVVILISARLIALKAPEFFQTESVQENITVIAPELPTDENAFYIDPIGKKPIFLNAKELEKKREALVWEKRDFIWVDESQARISRYEKGAIGSTFPIVAEPKLGSFFDIPGGFYTVQGKAKDHIIKNGRAHLAWAVYLYGNYLIHAALLPQGSTAMAAARDNAGIQLTREDARVLFDGVQDGMPVLVSRADSPADISFAYFRNTLLPHAVPEVTAAAALAADIDTGEVLFEKNKNDAYPTASLTKLMTAVIATEKVKPSRLLAVGDEALATYGNSAGLVKGEAFPASDLMHGLILESSNDIAVMFQLAVLHFISDMNERAKKLALAKTFFEDSSGLSRNNVTSAADLFSLLRFIDTTYPDILVWSRDAVYPVTSVGKKRTHVWSNVNWPRGDKRYLGGKAGFTDDSLQTMAGLWSTRMSEYGGRRIAITLLGSRSRVQDVRAIIAYLEKVFVYGFSSVADQKSRSAAISSEGAMIWEALDARR